MQAAKLLEGRTLNGRWIVLRQVDLGDDHSGGFFSVGYEVEDLGGNKGFLKALDFSKAFSGSNLDPARELAISTTAFNFERDLLKKCVSGNLSRIVKLLDEGTEIVPGSDTPGVTQFLIFEFADDDVRRQASVSRSFDTAWSLRCLHQVAVGISQLHSKGIAHQDLKPSNVLIFNGFGSKIGDLGNSADGTTPDELPHEQLRIAGDRGYAPPELHYNYVSPDWTIRRVGCDIYLLGSLVYFFFAGTNFTAKLGSLIDTVYFWDNWIGSYQDALPYVREAFEQAIDEFEASVPVEFSQELCELVRWSCDPDPHLRGFPSLTTRLGPMAMQRFVSKFDLLATRAETGMQKVLRR